MVYTIHKTLYFNVNSNGGNKMVYQSKVNLTVDLNLFMELIVLNGKYLVFP